MYNYNISVSLFLCTANYVHIF